MKKILTTILIVVLAILPGCNLASDVGNLTNKEAGMLNLNGTTIDVGITTLNALSNIGSLTGTVPDEVEGQTYVQATLQLESGETVSVDIGNFGDKTVPIGEASILSLTISDTFPEDLSLDGVSVTKSNKEEFIKHSTLTFSNTETNSINAVSRNKRIDIRYDDTGSYITFLKVSVDH